MNIMEKLNKKIWKETNKENGENFAFCAMARIGVQQWHNAGSGGWQGKVLSTEGKGEEGRRTHVAMLWLRRRVGIVCCRLVLCVVCV